MPAFREDLLAIYRETLTDVYGFVARRVNGNRTLAEDVVQETYCRAVAAWMGQGVPEQPRAWLCTVALNLIRSHYRRVNPERLTTQEMNTWFERGESAAEASNAPLIQWGIAQLKPERARLLQAFYFDGRSVKHIAAGNGVSEKAVERRLARARGDLRRVLSPHVSPGAGEE